MLSVHGSDALRAAVLGMKLARREIKNDINRATRATMNPVWRDEVGYRVGSKMDRRVLAQGARILAGNPPVAVAATSKRALSGGLVPAVQYAAVEFGADPNQVTTYTRRSPNGGTHKVTRHTTRGLPRRSPKGRVVYPAVKDLGPRLASLWVSIIVRKFNDALEKGT